MPREPIFRIVVGSQIVVSQQSLPYNDTLVTWTHNLGFDTICSRSTSKLIDDEKDTFKFFIIFDIMPYRPIFRVIVGS